MEVGKEQVEFISRGPQDPLGYFTVQSVNELAVDRPVVR